MPSASALPNSITCECLKPSSRMRGVHREVDVFGRGLRTVVRGRGLRSSGCIFGFFISGIGGNGKGCDCGRTTAPTHNSTNK